MKINWSIPLLLLFKNRISKTKPNLLNRHLPPRLTGAIPLLLLFSFAKLFSPSLAKSTPLLTEEHSIGVSISATIGKRFFTLNGYTSPQSQVFLDSQNLHLQTTSQTSGYFAFGRQDISPNTQEICLYSINSQNQHSATVCISPPPPGRYYTHVGPVLLPPTLTLSSPIIDPNSTTIASGESIPNSIINIHLYQHNSKAPIFPNQIHAFSLPSFSTQTDNLGNFSLTIPTSYSTSYRLFATTNFQNNPSPPSNTLFYSLPKLFSFIFLFLLLTPLALIFYFSLFRHRHYYPVPLALPAIASSSQKISIPSSHNNTFPKKNKL